MLTMHSLILDTETHTLYGKPIEIAYVPVQLHAGQLQLGESQFYDHYFSLAQGEAIHVASMAVHHILPQDIQNRPMYSTFRLPEETRYIIGHNVDYDIDAIARCGQDVSQIKRICTLAIARQLWPHLESHNLSALSYYTSSNLARTREQLKNAHNAKADVQITAQLLQILIQHYQIQNMEALYQLSQQARKPSTMPFGKHKGTPLKELPSDYILWLKRQDIDPYLREALNEVL